MSYSFSFCPLDGSKLVQIPGVKEGRKHCQTCDYVYYGNPKPCVAVFIINKKQVLLARRGVEPAKGMWDIPGGFIDIGESASEAVEREALEETNLKVKVEKYLGSVPDTYGSMSEQTLNFCFVAAIVDGTVEAKSDVDSLEWFDLNHLPKDMAFPHQSKMIDWLRQSVINSG